MRTTSSLACALFFACALASPLRAQTQIPAPAGWKTQTKANGATTYTPPDLKAGEIYSVTIYDAAPLGGQTPEAYLRKFAGPVGTEAGKLRAPLQVNAGDARQASGTGVYRGPNGRDITAAFVALSPDGGHNIAVARVLTSADAVFFRYKNSLDALTSAIVKSALATSNPVASGEESVAEQPRPAVKAREDAKKAEEQRYPFGVAAGKGVLNAQIAAAIHYYGNGQFDPARDYLLLTDGAIYDGIPPVALDEFNALLSKREEPKMWGHWRRVKDKYQASWEGKPFEELNGVSMVPAPPGLRIAGHFQGGSGSSGLGFSHWTSWGTTFDRAGRFREDGEKSISVGSFGSVGNGVVTRSDENGTSTMMQGPNFSAGGDTSNAATPRSKSGNYSFNGYTLTLRYSDGRIERAPIFFTDKDYDALWMPGGLMFLEKPEPKK